MTRPMRIAITSIEYPPQAFSSGIGSYTKAIAEGLVERGHHVHVLTRGIARHSIEQVNGVTVEYIVPARAELPQDMDSTTNMLALGLRGAIGEARYRRRLAQRVHALVSRDGFDVVEAADHLGEAAWYLPSRHPHVPFVVRLHTPVVYSEQVEHTVPAWVTAIVGAQERRQARRATHLSSPSATMVEPFLKALNATGRPVEVYPNPSMLMLGSEEPVSDPEGPPIILFVGRLTGWKGVDTLMRATPNIVRAHPDVRIQIVGADTGPTHGFASHRAYLESLLPDEVREHVAFFGKVNQAALESYYRRATICVFPSRFDVLPYTCLEAMRFGKAIIGSHDSGMRDMLDDGAAGLLHHPPHVDDLTQKILALLGDGDLRRRLGARAFERARTDLSRSRALDAAERFYARAIEDVRVQASNRDASPVAG